MMIFQGLFRVTGGRGGLVKTLKKIVTSLIHDPRYIEFVSLHLSVNKIVPIEGSH